MRETISSHYYYGLLGGIMKKLLLIILSFFMMVWTASAGEFTLQERVMNHPDAIEMIEGWYRVVIKENLSDTEFDWRFDVRSIDVQDGHVYFGHRLEQNSSNIPNSNWVIEYSFSDLFEDGILDTYDKSRFISVDMGDGAWYRISPTWPDEFRYPDLLSEDEAEELFKEELEWWNNNL